MDFDKYGEVYRNGSVILINCDCMDIMKDAPENYWDLSCVDPPYGIEKGFQATSRIAKYGQMNTVNDAKPNKQYFDELMRVSKNQIVWGYNHLCDLIGPTKEFIFWYKHQPVTSYSDGELAYTSFKKTAKCFDHAFFGGVGADENKRIHPTQKPVRLYSWLLQNYAKPGQRILDTHLGSGSSAIAAHYFGCDFVGCEIDKDYYDAACKRFDKETRQLAMNF